MTRLGIIGTGTVGSALALLLQEKGYKVTGVCSKQGFSAQDLAARLKCRHVTDPVELLPEADIVFLTVPDRELESLAVLLAGSGQSREGQIFLHTSGALPAEVLEPLKANGAEIGSVHPLQAFADIEKAMENLPGSYFAIQGDTNAVEASLKIVKALGGKAFLLAKDHKALYHLGASAASNYLVSLIHFAVNIYKHIGMTEDQAKEALLPLIKGTLANIDLLGPTKALTGPIARGDAGTVERHLEALSGLGPHLIDVYSALGRYTVRVALEKGSIDPNTAEELLMTIEKGGCTRGRQ